MVFSKKIKITKSFTSFKGRTIELYLCRWKFMLLYYKQAAMSLEASNVDKGVFCPEAMGEYPPKN